MLHALLLYMLQVPFFTPTWARLGNAIHVHGPCVVLLSHRLHVFGDLLCDVRLSMIYIDYAYISKHEAISCSSIIMTQGTSSREESFFLLSRRMRTLF